MPFLFETDYIFYSGNLDRFQPPRRVDSSQIIGIPPLYCPFLQKMMTVLIQTQVKFVSTSSRAVFVNTRVISVAIALMLQKTSLFKVMFLRSQKIKQKQKPIFIFCRKNLNLLIVNLLHFLQKMMGWRRVDVLRLFNVLNFLRIFLSDYQTKACLHFCTYKF